MMKKEHCIRYEQIENWREQGVVPAEIQSQLEELLNTAYAPYSHYPVASVVVMANGAVFVGTNQENASFPAGVCAERVAILAAKAAHPATAVDAVYIMTRESKRMPAAPCGVCRQVLSEVELRQEEAFDLLLMNETSTLLRFKGMQDLLPFRFTMPEV